MDILVKNVNHLKLNKKIASGVLNTQTLKMIWCYANVYVAKWITAKIWWNLKSRFANGNEFSNHGISTFIMLLQKDFYLFE